MHEAFTAPDVTTQPCPTCDGTADRQLAATASVAYENSDPQGLGPQATGVEALDFDFDHVVAEDARKHWAVVEARSEHKRGVLANNPGATGADLSKQNDGSYIVMKPNERRAVENARTINNYAMHQYHSRGRGQGSGG